MFTPAQRRLPPGRVKALSPSLDLRGGPPLHREIDPYQGRWVQDGKVVGIVSRANLLLALVKRRKQLATESPVADSTLREAIIERLEREPWSRTSLINVEVHDGTVDLRGIVISPVEKKALRAAAEVTPGVREVNDSVLVWPNEEFGTA